MEQLALFITRQKTSVSEKFVAPSANTFKQKVKLLRTFVGKDSLPLMRAYELAARVCGHQSWNELSARLRSEVPRDSIWDEDLDDSQLALRREFQVSVLMEGMGVPQSEAEEILDAVGISSKRWRHKALATDSDMRPSTLIDEAPKLEMPPLPAVTYRKRRTLSTKAES